MWWRLPSTSLSARVLSIVGVVKGDVSRGCWSGSQPGRADVMLMWMLRGRAGIMLMWTSARTSRYDADVDVSPDKEDTKLCVVVVLGRGPARCPVHAVFAVGGFALSVAESDLCSLRNFCWLSMLNDRRRRRVWGGHLVRLALDASNFPFSSR
ncbi:hypothetical protein BDY17DRAFT_297770 [Neohortaea acidophila]|uniref:Uncharacterized protein n=1 Tax=Neohortaea acidophila TaxID=245834 RepID=A0A6A6PVY3_9PEZI|nr:uncharacterized protein BDY17DRAFT_297770 [Neohortaea acidophila]KAF2483643.1 hypothetical protein BDY17DRAFT_297770 [Neohortaea acidophila]